MRWTAAAKQAGVLLSAAVLATLVGCGDVQYQLSAVLGELRLLSLAKPIDQVLASDSLSEEQRARLEFVVRARDFGEHVIGLNVGNSYRNFVNLNGEPLSWNLSASRKDRFEPYVWPLLIGQLPYLGYFNYDEAIVERDRLVAQGYDTVLYEVDAFSTLGVLPDPVTSSILDRSLPSLADTVLHELTHNTISKLSDTNFNETLATFVGRTAAVQFLVQEFGADADIVRQAREGYEDADRLNVFFQSLVTELNTLYNSDASSEDKIARRVDVVKAALQRYRDEVLPLMHDQASYAGYADFPVNNAFLLLNVRYNDRLDVFQKAFDAVGGDWGQALSLFSQAAAQEDSFGFLQAVAP